MIFSIGVDQIEVARAKQQLAREESVVVNIFLLSLRFSIAIRNIAFHTILQPVLRLKRFVLRLLAQLFGRPLSGRSSFCIYLDKGGKVHG